MILCLRSCTAGTTVNLKEPFVTDQSQQRVRSKLWVCWSIRVWCSQWPPWTPGSGLQDCNSRSCQFGTVLPRYQEEKASPTFPGLAGPTARQLCLFLALVWQLSWNMGPQSASRLYGNWQAARADGHAPQWLGWGMAQKVETRCYTLNGKLNAGKKKKLTQRKIKLFGISQ